MPRYFIEVTYKGTNFSGFQVQHNAITIQSEVERAFRIKFSVAIRLTGSSRTDAGVHALQNYFHFDAEKSLFSAPGQRAGPEFRPPDSYRSPARASRERPEY